MNNSIYQRTRTNNYVEDGLQRNQKIYNFEKFYYLDIKYNNKNEDKDYKPTKKEQVEPEKIDNIPKKEKNEVLITGNEIITLSPILKVSKSICKIITPQGQGSGFLI